MRVQLITELTTVFRTPLTTIKGSVTALMEPTVGEDREARSALLAETLIAVDEDVPLISVDFILMVQALTNILQNVARYTPAGTRVELRVKRKGSAIRITEEERRDSP